MAIKPNFVEDVASSALSVFGNDQYCIVGLRKRHEATYFLKSFDEINLKEVIREAVYFNLHLPVQTVGTSHETIRFRSYHFAIYANEQLYYWSFRARSFEEAPKRSQEFFTAALKQIQSLVGRNDLLGIGGLKKNSWDYYQCVH